MFVRNILLAIGILALVAGSVMSFVWVRQVTQPSAVAPEATRQAVLVAAHALTSGSLLRPEDIRWKEVAAGNIRVGNLMRGQIAEAELIGAIVRRDFAADEPLVVSELVRPSERQFLAAALRPGMRAVSIAVDAPQSAAGLILPGDQVDVILTQNFTDNTAAPNRRSVAETVLRDVRVIAIDQTLSLSGRPAPPAARPGLAPGDTRTPRTVTFEVTEHQAEVLTVAAQLGRLQLSVRPLQAAPTEPRPAQPVWAADVSPALNDLTQRGPQQPGATTGGGIESAIRRPPAAGGLP